MKKHRWVSVDDASATSQRGAKAAGSRESSRKRKSIDPELGADQPILIGKISEKEIRGGQAYVALEVNKDELSVCIRIYWQKKSGEFSKGPVGAILLPEEIDRVIKLLGKARKASIEVLQEDYRKHRGVPNETDEE